MLSARLRVLTSSSPMKHVGENVVRIEADALRALADRIAGPMAEAFNRAVQLLYACSGRVVVTGMGKSGLIARKIAATLSSTGTPALFMHPVEAVHGDLGMVVRGDVVIALSSSGETEEILSLLATLKRLQVPLISMTGDAVYESSSFDSAQGSAVSRPRQNQDDNLKKRGSKLSTLAAAADVALDCSVAKEACSLGLAPTASTTTMLALGDALAMALAEKRGFKEEDFANLHPGGKLGKRLARDVIYEMSRKKLGVTTVVEGERLVGIISDGDLRRLLERRGKDVLDLNAGECMTKTPKTISGQEFAATALALMEEKKITSLVIVDGSGKLEGIVHLHDLWGTEMM